MSQLLKLKGNETVLEIGTGSGYQSAILSLLAKKVVSIERIKKLADRAKKLLAKVGYENVEVIYADGSKGYKKHAPYDAIIVTAASGTIPEQLIQQLKPNGRIVIPVNTNGSQMLQIGIRRKDSLHTRDIVRVSFVPVVHGKKSV